MTGVNESYYDDDLTNKCLFYEKNDILIENGTIIKKCIGFIFEKKATPLSYLNLCTEKCVAKEKNAMNLCQDHIQIQHDTHLLYTNSKVNIIVVPDHLFNEWEYHCSEFNANNTKQQIYVVNNASTTDVRNYHDNDVIVIKNSDLKTITNYLLIKMIKISRLILICYESLKIARHIKIYYDFLWLSSSLIKEFIYCNGDDEIYKMLLKRKGFVKDILIEIKKIPPNILEQFCVENNSDQEDILDNNINHIVVRCSKQTDLYECLDKNDISNAITLIQPKIEFNESKAFKSVYTGKFDIIKHINCQIDLLITSSREDYENRINILNQKKHHEEEKTQTILERIKRNTICNICFENINNKTILNCCFNSFCFICINKWLQYNSVCPMCKKHVNVTKDQIMVLNDKDNTYLNKECISNKNSELENFLLLIQSFQKGQFILIYNKEKNFSKILKSQNIKYSLIKYIRNRSGNKPPPSKYDVFLINDDFSPYDRNILSKITDVIFFTDISTSMKKYFLSNIKSVNENSKLQVWHLSHDQCFL